MVLEIYLKNIIYIFKTHFFMVTTFVDICHFEYEYFWETMYVKQIINIYKKTTSCFDTKHFNFSRVEMVIQTDDRAIGELLQYDTNDKTTSLTN